MSIKILTINSELESATKLAKDYGWLVGTYFGGYSEDFDKDIIVRWGNSDLYCSRDGLSKEFKNVLNPSVAIRTNCKKRTALELISKFVDTPTIFYDKVPTGQLVVYRPTTHTSGRGFQVVKGPVTVEPETYATEFIKTNTEIRVWYINDTTLVARRVRMEINGPPKKYECRSEWGYSFIPSCPELNRKVKLSLAAVGLEFGACDILVKDDKYIFLENNSAASADHSKVRSFFQEGLLSLCRQKWPNLMKNV